MARGQVVCQVFSCRRSGMGSQEETVQLSSIIYRAIICIGKWLSLGFTRDEGRSYFRSIFKPYSVPGIMNKPPRTVMNAKTSASDRAEARPLMATLSSVVPT